MIASRSAQSNVRVHGDDFLKVNAITSVDVTTAIEIKRVLATKSVAHTIAAHNHHVSG